MSVDGPRPQRPGPDGGQAPALQLTGLLKRFGGTTAVDHVDLTVPGGSFFGLVGPNGAGKTTTLSMAVGLLRPDAGRAQVFGVDVLADPLRRPEPLGRPARPRCCLAGCWAGSWGRWWSAARA
jgi:ABC-2 type transport system ATP-binding protein